MRNHPEQTKDGTIAYKTDISTEERDGQQKRWRQSLEARWQLGHECQGKFVGLFQVANVEIVIQASEDCCA